MGNSRLIWDLLPHLLSLSFRLVNLLDTGETIARRIMYKPCIFTSKVDWHSIDIVCIRLLQKARRFLTVNFKLCIEIKTRLNSYKKISFIQEFI